MRADDKHFGPNYSSAGRGRCVQIQWEPDLTGAKDAGLNHLPVVPKTVKTPVGMNYEGVSFQGRICGVSIMRGKLSQPKSARSKLI